MQDSTTQVMTSRPLSLATWVWQTKEVIGDSEQREAVLAFAKASGVSKVYAQLSSSFEEGQEIQQLAAFLQACQAQGLAIEWTAGQPEWALPDNFEDALKAIQIAQRVNSQLAAQGLPGVPAILFDVEPYLLDQWESDQTTLVSNFAELISTLKSAAAAANLEVWWTVPFWLSDLSTQGIGLDAYVLQNSDGIVIMGYRDSPEAVGEVVNHWIDVATPLNRPIVVAIETQCIEPGYTSFCGQTPQDFRKAIDDLWSRLSSKEVIRAIAVHDLDAWRSLMKDTVSTVEE